MGDAVVWVHDFSMRPGSPAFRAAGPAGAPGVFVFDEDWIARERLSVKRLVFLYECAIEMGLEIRRGNVVAAVLDFARERGASRVLTVECASPRVAAQVEALRRRIRVDAAPDDVLVDLAGREPDLRRFSRYWSTAQWRALTPTPRERGV